MEEANLKAINVIREILGDIVEDIEKIEKRLDKLEGVNDEKN